VSGRQDSFDRLLEHPGKAVNESFSRSWRGWIRSSEGYSVRLLGRSKLTYADGDGELQISAEAMAKPWSDIVVYTSTIPNTAERPRTQVVEHLRRAFAFAGWNLLEGSSRRTDPA
jgi:hypothetical protein